MNFMKVLCKLSLRSVLAAVSVRVFETGSEVVEKGVFSGYDIG